MGLKNLQKLAGVDVVDTAQTSKDVNPFEDVQSSQEAAPPTTEMPKPKPPSGTMAFLGNVGKTIGGLGIGAAKSFLKLPQMAAEFGSDVGLRAAAAVRHDVTYEDLKKKMDTTGLSKAVERPEWTKAHGTAEKVGETLGDVGQFFIPAGGVAKAAGLAGKAAEVGKAAETVGEAAKAVGTVAEKTPFIEKAASFLKSSLKEGVEQAARTGVQTGDAKDAATAGAFGVATPTANLALKGIGGVGKQVVETISSKLSGVPKDAIEHAIANPSAVKATMRAMAKDPEVGAQRVLEHATDAFDAMKDARREAYRVGLKKVEEETMKDQAGNWLVKKGNKFVPVDLSTETSKKKLFGTLQDFGAVVKDGNIDMSKVALPNAQKRELQEVVEKIQSWDDFSPMGIDDLRENIAVYKKGGIAQSSADKKFNKIVEDTLGSLRKHIREQVPQIGEMNDKYHAMSEPLERIAQELRLEKNPVMAMRKLTNAFSPKSAVYRDLIKELGEQGAKDLLSDIAGLTMAKWTPEGLGAYIGTLGGGGAALLASPAALPGIAATAAMSSPRLIGEAATAAGAASKAIKPALPALRTGQKAIISEASRK